MTNNDTSLRLRQAIVLDDLALVQRLLNRNPSLLHNPSYGDKAETSLHLAASLGLTEIARHLIVLGHDSAKIGLDDICGDPNSCHGISVNTDGQTPLHLASANLHTAVVQLLCERFPTTINRKDKEGRTPLLLAAGTQARPATQTPLVSFSKPVTKSSEDVSTISTLLLYGADVGSKDHRGNTCLHNACAFGNLKAIRALVQAGADPLCMNFEGWKPELYSLTVQAEVYYRNLVSEYGKRKAEEKRVVLDKKSKSGGGVRLVPQDDEDSDDANSQAGRSRADSGRSQSTFESARS